ncbi:class I SAM-dependent methyltransferase [Actinoplanes sp. TBRC 11911]|uniref:class I SAM-dependent methyltransferase n=1 Tax=Actinoplanes sp. TBRC 11911 TaxID=2729386 RepID=UPI00145EC3FD|nr:class I SAM-dependent methyltransferase [Actinoplanes sp. TBRC 11911]NMO52717.1 class I SAM-dependent methyltransferase [Actinoplanes sp. TBRC 11911]
MKSDVLAQRLFEETIGALDLYSIYLGDQLGYYRAMTGGDWLTAEGLAQRTGTSVRYTEEWLSQQAVRELVEVQDERADPRRYRLPAEHVPVLADPDSMMTAVASTTDVARSARRLPDLVTAFRTGQAPPSLPWEPEGRSEPSRGLYLNFLGKQWLPSIPEVDRRLRQPGARIADIASGTGWSSIAMAEAYPLVSVDGIDLDGEAVAEANRYARERGLSDRVRFEAGDAASLAGERYDVVTIIQALHDMSNPVEVLRTVRKSLAEDAFVLVVDSHVAEEFSVPGTPQEQLDYGVSLMVCLPNAMGPGSAATGMVMRPGTVRRYAAEAGFAAVRLLPIESKKWNFYQLTV